MLCWWYKFKISVKNINIKKRTYYFFDGIIHITDFDQHNTKIDEKSYKKILIYYIGYVRIKKELEMAKSFVPYFW